MRKKIFLLLSFVLALAMSIGVLTACGGKKVTVEISKETLTLVTGQKRGLTATASNGAEIEWTTSSESVATVSDKGMVEAVAAGTATITATAKGSDASASCQVTVVGITFKVDGEAQTAASVDMNNTLQLTIETTDSSTAASWTSSAEDVATVNASGLVTAIKPGETNISVVTSSGVSAIIVVTVNATGDYQEITQDSKAPGEWWYYTSTEGGRATDVSTAFYNNGKVNFNFAGNGNWYIDDIQLGHTAPNGTTVGWKKVTGKIEASNITPLNPATENIVITMFGTEVSLVEGDTTFSVCYEQTTGGNDMYIRFGGTGCLLTGANITLSDLQWADHTVKALTTPSFTLNEDDVEITDNANQDGVKTYQIGLFDASDKQVFAQNFDISGGALDTSALELDEDTEFSVKIKAVGQPGYTDSEWSTTDVKYTVEKHEVRYTLKDTDNSEAQNDTKLGKWTYWAGDGGSVTSVPEYVNGTINVNANLGWAWYSVQLFRTYSQYSLGADLHVTMKINASAAYNITITGNVVELKEGDNEVELWFKNPDGATLSIQFGVNGTTPEGGEYTFVISNVAVEEFIPEALKVPAGVFNGEGEDKTITVTDTENEEANVAAYEVGFFDDNTLIGSVVIAQDGSFSDLAIKDGTYSLKIRAIPAKAAYTTSDWSAVIKTGYVVANGGVVADIPFGGDVDNPNAVSDPGNWYYWNDQNWLGSTVAVEQAKYSESNGSIIFTYKVTAGTNTEGVRLFYKNPELTVGNNYKLTLKINSVNAVSAKLNGTNIELNAGDNEITVYYKETVGIGYSFEMLVAVNATVIANNTLTLTNIAWEACPALSAPSIAIDGSGIVTITDSNAEGVASYVAGFYKGSSLAASVPVVNGQAIDVSKVGNGEYTVKIMAKAGAGYSDSDWSATGVNYTVAKESNTIPLVAGDAEAGIWRYWCPDAPADWNSYTSVNVTNAVYDMDKNEISLTFTSNGTLDWGLQIVYEYPNYTNQTCSFTVEADFDCTIQTVRNVNNPYELKAGVPQEVTMSVAEFYLQVNLVGDNFGGTIKLSNIQWN